jgi:hypothetical protein
MSSTMMQLLIGLMRHNGMRYICRAYLPTVSLNTTSELLGFGVTDDGVMQCKHYLTKIASSREGTKGNDVDSSVVFTDESETMIDTKLTITKGYFTGPYMFKIMDGDSVTGT